MHLHPKLLLFVVAIFNIIGQNFVVSYSKQNKMKWFLCPLVDHLRNVYKNVPPNTIKFISVQHKILSCNSVEVIRCN